MLKHTPITAIKIGPRRRKEMGDLTTLAKSIRQWPRAKQQIR